MAEAVYGVFLMVCLFSGIGGNNPARENELRCQQLGRQPLFEPDLVVDRTWRIYYTWHMKLGQICMNMNFQPATSAIVKRIYSDMNEYMEEDPEWSAASLLLTMGRMGREMLLLADQTGAAGRFSAVPDVVRDGNIAPSRKTIPLIKFQMNMLENGRYLVMMDCHIGVASLAARLNDGPPTMTEVERVALQLQPLLDVGEHACLEDLQKNVNETELRFDSYLNDQ